MQTSTLAAFRDAALTELNSITGGQGGNGRAHPPTSQDIGNEGTSESATNEDNRHSQNNTNRPGNEGV